MIFSIGQVTKMYNISHDTLRYYDKIGALKPSYKKENGYRYYTIKEIEILEIILLSKKLEIPIKDIKDLIEKENINKYIDFFEKHEKSLEKKIEELTILKEQVKKDKDLLRYMKEFKNNDNELKTIHLNKEIILFSQKGDSYIGTVYNGKNLFMKLRKDENNKFIIDTDYIGIEKFDGISEFPKNTKYINKSLSGEYYMITKKEDSKSIEECINNQLSNMNLNLESDDIYIESMFTLSKKDKNEYFVNIYIKK